MFINIILKCFFIGLYQDMGYICIVFSNFNQKMLVIRKRIYTPTEEK